MPEALTLSNPTCQCGATENGSLREPAYIHIYTRMPVRSHNVPEALTLDNPTCQCGAAHNTTKRAGGTRSQTQSHALQPTAPTRRAADCRPRSLSSAAHITVHECVESNYGHRSNRKPRSLSRPVGVLKQRYGTRQSLASQHGSVRHPKTAVYIPHFSHKTAVCILQFPQIIPS